MSSLGSISDDELLSLLGDKRNDAFTEIYSRYWKKMLLVAWNHTKNKTTAEDIVHEVFISLWQKKDIVSIENLAGFLTTAVKFSIFKNHQRELRRSELARQNYTFADITLDEEKLDALFLQEYVNGLIEELPERCRMVFKYSRELGMKNSEIAAEMNISEKGVEANLTRALKVIRGGLKNSGILLLVAEEIHKGLF